MTDYPVEPDTFPKDSSRGSGGIVAYAVEARLAYYTPRQVAGMLLDTRWRKVEFAETTPFGVPNGHSYNSPWLRMTGLFEYQAAQALRWWFLAQAEVEFSCGCVETRLIEHEINYSYTSTAKKAVAPIGGEDRSAIMPDWGVKPPPVPSRSPQVTKND